VRGATKRRVHAKGTSCGGVGRRRAWSVGCAPVECVDGWIVVGSLFGGVFFGAPGETFMRVAGQDGAAGVLT